MSAMNKVESQPAIFERHEIRRVYDEATETWRFSIIDIIQALTQQPDYQTSRKYWNKLKERLGKEGSQLVANCHQLKMAADDGKQRLTDVATAETLPRLVQSAPSRKALTRNNCAHRSRPRPEGTRRPGRGSECDSEPRPAGSPPGPWGPPRAMKSHRIHPEGGIHLAPGFSPTTGGAKAPRGLKPALRVSRNTRPRLQRSGHGDKAEPIKPRLAKVGYGHAPASRTGRRKP
jgi:hypothetical protein